LCVGRADGWRIDYYRGSNSCSVIIAGLFILVVTAAYFAISGNGDRLIAVVNSTIPLITFFWDITLETLTDERYD
jgi:drug/metabolite transporter (DMT)-like permease